MSTTRPWITDILKQFRLNVDQPRNGHRLDVYRIMIKRMRLAERMHEIYLSINSEAGRSILYEQCFMQPQHMLCQYTFDNGNIEYQMSVTFLASGPALVFASHRRDNVPHQILRVYGDFVDKMTSIRYWECLIDPSRVSDRDLQQWFTFLLSGTRRRWSPKIRRWWSGWGASNTPPIYTSKPLYLYKNSLDPRSSRACPAASSALPGS